MKRKVVLLQGAFDILHAAHFRAFKFAKSKGDYLIIALNSNYLIKQYKGRDAVMPWDQKKFMIESCRYVDKVVKAGCFSPIKLLKKHKVDVFIITREWLASKNDEIAYMKGKGGKVFIARRSKTVSTTAIKAKLLQEHLDATHSTVVQGDGHASTAGHPSNGSMPSYVLHNPTVGAVRDGKTGSNGEGLSENGGPWVNRIRT